MALHKIDWLTGLFPGMGPHSAYRLVRANPELAVRVGRRIYVSEERVRAFIAAGGKARQQRDDSGSAPVDPHPAA